MREDSDTLSKRWKRWKREGINVLERKCKGCGITMYRLPTYSGSDYCLKPECFKLDMEETNKQMEEIHEWIKSPKTHTREELDEYVRVKSKEIKLNILKQAALEKGRISKEQSDNIFTLEELEVLLDRKYDDGQDASYDAPVALEMADETKTT